MNNGGAEYQILGIAILKWRTFVQGIGANPTFTIAFVSVVAHCVIFDAVQNTEVT
jgi:hypothetical protein